eukprot:SAG31_NODE_2442_length_5683_cov_8.114792_3_plen_166_part_00
MLARAPSSAGLIAPPRLIAIIDELLVKPGWCTDYRIGSCSAIEVWPGETAQVLHRDDGIYPLQLSGVELQVSVLWALTRFSEENGATRVVLGSHGNQATGLEIPRRLRGSPYGPEATVAANMAVGSALLYLGSTHHGGGANSTQQERRIGLVNTYALGCAPNASC